MYTALKAYSTLIASTLVPVVFPLDELSSTAIISGNTALYDPPKEL